jgi:transposase
MTIPSDQPAIFTAASLTRSPSHPTRTSRSREWLAGHELAVQHFGGVPDRIVVDNAKAMVLTHTCDAIVWNPT